MNPHTTFSAALLGAALLLSLAAHAAPTMSPPTTLSAKARTAVLSQLAGQRQAKGLDQDHHYRITAQHPGANGTQILRAAHTWKGLRVFGSDSVVVLDQAAKVVSESASERRLHLGSGSANRLGALTQNFSVQPQVTRSAALAAALASLAPSVGG
ncbi:MAG: M4 family metallopeptidase, partial [Telluria sp.]